MLRVRRERAGRSCYLCLSLLAWALVACTDFSDDERAKLYPIPASLIYRVEHGDMAAVAARARESCSHFGQKAARESITQSGSDTFVTYGCK